MIDKIYICSVPIAPCYDAAKDEAEMVTQLLFGEMVHVLEEAKENWLKIRIQNDGYIAWISSKQIELLNTLPTTSEKTTDLLTKAYDSLGNIYLPAGSILPNFKNSVFGFGTTQYTLSKPLVENNDTLINTACMFLNAPYLWGGKSILGIDCSGFTQLVFGLHGKQLPRDSGDQKSAGKSINFESHKEGDLAFFKNKKDKITHVGLILKNNKIIHASGKVRIDNFSSEGIYHCEQECLTHVYDSIARY